MHHLPDQNLSYFKEGSEHFDDYVEAVHWAQEFAMTNRRLMMAAVMEALAKGDDLPPFERELEAGEYRVAIEAPEYKPTTYELTVAGRTQLKVKTKTWRSLVSAIAGVLDTKVAET